MLPGGECGPTREDDIETRQKQVITQACKRPQFTRENQKPPWLRGMIFCRGLEIPRFQSQGEITR